jgi:hypothetical protein
MDFPVPAGTGKSLTFFLQCGQGNHCSEIKKKEMKTEKIDKNSQWIFVTVFGRKRGRRLETTSRICKI